MISATLTVVGMAKTTKKQGPSNGSLVVEHSIPLLKQNLLVCKSLWELSGSQESLPYPVIDF
jgi:hypothetical protein